MTSRSSLGPRDWRLQVWRTFLMAHAQVVAALERDLSVAAQLPLGWYDVLLQLVEAPERRLRMAELADRVLLSRSGLTRLVDRLQREGLVVREPVPGDARGLYTVLTPAGLARIREATPIHLAGVDEYWVSRFSDDELHELKRLLDRVGRPGQPADGQPGD
jgi:DNA-binding MarR family transcriptional regulator